MKILFVAPTLNPPGGGELVAAWFVEALCTDHEITLLAWEAPRIDECNRHFGTSLARSDFRLRLMPAALRRSLEHVSLRAKRLRDAFLTRACLALAPQFDLVVTSNNEMDLGGLGVQYLHFPQEDLFVPGIPLKVARVLVPVAHLYRWVCDRIAGDSLDRIRSNMTLVNSDWTGRWARTVHPIATRTVYPPVPGTFAEVAWQDRDDAVIATGRLVPEKRFEEIIEAAAAVRAAGYRLELTIVAFAGGNPAYAARIRALVRRHQDWATLREDVTRAELDRLLVRHRYGIHAMVDEHFGIAVAEMVKAGCIVLVPIDGGPAEIVGDAPELKFSGAEDAARQMQQILAEPELRERLRRHLRGRASLFSPERFVAEVRAAVREAQMLRERLSRDRGSSLP